MKIALAAYHDKVKEKMRYDDRILKLALERLGNEIEVIDWQDEDVENLHLYQAIVVSTTWNLHKYPREFELWLKNCESDGRKRLINDESILKLGIRKDSYFISLMESFGVVDSSEGSVIPSIFITKENVKYRNKSFMEILSILIKNNQQLWSKDIVIKPITSAGGENTYRLTNNVKLLKKDQGKYKSFIKANNLFSKTLQANNKNGVIIQPFMSEIERNGEYQLIFIETEYSHAILKPIGFRNTDFSGKRYIDKKYLPKGMFSFANSLMNFFVSRYGKSLLTKVRIDLFCGEKGPILCEVELIEPNINIECLPKSLGTSVAKNFAKAIIRQANQFLLINQA